MNEILSEKVKKAYYRSNHRGCKENDILLGVVSIEFLKELSESQIDTYLFFLEESDNTIYDWLTNKSPLPSKYDFIGKHFMQKNSSF